MNKYYILKPAVGTKETGMAYPAVESYDDYDFDGPRSMHKLKFREFPDFEPDIRFKLAKGAKLCDMMGQATINANGFLISEKLKLILEQTNTVPCIFYKATIENKGTIYKYFWVHFVWEDCSNYIDYKNSDFFAKRLSKNLGKVNILKEDDILSIRKEFDIATVISYNEIKFVNLNKDLFTINFFTQIYITEKLKELLDSNHISGIDIIQTDKIKTL